MTKHEKSPYLTLYLELTKTALNRANIFRCIFFFIEANQVSVPESTGKKLYVLGDFMYATCRQYLYTIHAVAYLRIPFTSLVFIEFQWHLNVVYFFEHIARRVSSAGI